MFPAVLAAVVLSFDPGSPGTATRTRPAHADARLADLEIRTAALEAEGSRWQAVYTRSVRPLERELSRYSHDDALVARIAVALAREGPRVGVDPFLLASVIEVEDPSLDPAAVSSQGAIGLMQVMPVHAGAWGCSSSDLADPEANICHGARILANDLRLEHGDVDRALLRYNGCVHGANTAGCHAYPGKVRRYEALALADRRRPVDGVGGAP